ncbi:SNF2 family N-terminal domain-containing protein [Pseudoneurospora amorphoporcata]|uniref:SNF2 family N-terminal domain-containing protein n=1 Tax=Pseudoneurospora amorphoporcata TaxID=241081 RepID=A0AAN6P5C6_9PEZI|nr:SNF2 family N-terminal domain-containing protein [Pseudoneurospora amorphoporcata]
MDQFSDSHPEENETRAYSAPARPNMSTYTRLTGKIPRQSSLSHCDEVKAEDPEEFIASVRNGASSSIQNTVKDVPVKKEETAGPDVNQIMPIHQHQSRQNDFVDLTVDDDDDDDCMIIDEADVPESVKMKASSKTFSTKAPTAYEIVCLWGRQVAVKVEDSGNDNGNLDDDNGLINDNDSSVANGDDSGSSNGQLFVSQDSNGDDETDEFHMDEYAELSDGSVENERRRRHGRRPVVIPQKRPSKKIFGNHPETGPTAQHIHKEHDSDEDDDIEEIECELQVLVAEQNLLERRSAKGKLTPAGEMKLEEVGRKIERLQRRLGASVDPPSVNGYSNRNTPQISRIPATDSSKKRKGAYAEPGKARAKKSKPEPKMTAHKKNKQKQKAMQMITSMLSGEDPVMARARMGVLSTFDSLPEEARTVEGMERHIRDVIEADEGLPTQEKKRIAGDLKQLREARVAFGKKNYKQDGGTWKIAGLKSQLHHYQFAGAGWMVNRERSGDVSGGFQCDDTGLGKTVMTLACIAGNPPWDRDEDPTRGGTLIVVPASAVSQWMEEIAKHTSRMTFDQYHSTRQHRMRQGSMNRMDIVVSSYQEVVKGFPSEQYQKSLLQQGLSLPEVSERMRRREGELFKVKWFRVILDECHAIKNHKTQTTRACLALQGEHKWLLSATPIQNGLSELYPFLRFLKVPDTSSFRFFRRKFELTGPQQANGPPADLSALLSKIILKRDITTVFLGRALFEIPITHPDLELWVNFSREETLIYRMVEGKFRREINHDLMQRAGNDTTADNFIKSYLTLALRLRQATAHPYLLESLMRDHFTPDDIQHLKEELSKIKTNERYVQQIGRWCDGLVQQGVLRRHQNGENDHDEFGQGDYGEEFDMAPQLESMQKAKMDIQSRAEICNVCFELTNEPEHNDPKCDHVYCPDCIRVHVEKAKSRKAKRYICPDSDCRRGLLDPLIIKYSTESARDDRASVFSRSEADPTARKHSSVRRSKEGHFELGDDFHGFQPMGDPRNATFLAEADRKHTINMTPSAKTTRLKDIILGWQKEAPEDKIIVFTQWILLARVLGRVLQQEKIDFLYLFGGMGPTDREDQINAFQANPRIKVLVSSLRVGGQSLNLTAANRVVILDAWWNNGMEKQAFGRVFRFGQKKESWFTRILAKNTIDKRLVKMQKDKLKAIGKAIQANDNTKHKLTDEEVGSLFGRVKKQRDGTLVIESDYEDDKDDDGNDHQDTTNGGEGSSRVLRTRAGESGNDSDSDSDSDW